MCRVMISMLLLLAQVPVREQQDSLLVVFWNLENFFDWKDDGTSDSDREFSEYGAKKWTKSRFYAKCNAVAKTLYLMADLYGRMPDAVGVAEVENSFVLRQLIRCTSLSKSCYKVVHFESPDIRGIDCALLYRPEALHFLGAESKHVYDSTGAVMKTRDILLVRFLEMTILVNHHPSKRGGSSDRRRCAMARMKELCDSLGNQSFISMGDFNDDVWGGKGKGTYKYAGGWEKIDGCFYGGFESVRESVFSHPYLTVEDSSYGGTKPRRTYSGPRYLGGVSDHYPVTLIVPLQSSTLE